MTEWLEYSLLVLVAKTWSSSESPRESRPSDFLQGNISKILMVHANQGVSYQNLMMISNRGMKLQCYKEGY